MNLQSTDFELFDVPARFAQDTVLLDGRWKDLQRQVHPDRFADRPAAERRVAEQWSTRINEAFKLLKSPVKRAAWLCENAGRPIEAETNTRMPADFLMTQIMWREALESGDAGAADAVRAEAGGVRVDVVRGLAEAIDEKADWAAAVDLTRRLMFIDRFLEEAARDSK